MVGERGLNIWRECDDGHVTLARRVPLNIKQTVEDTENQRLTGE